MTQQGSDPPTTLHVSRRTFIASASLAATAALVAFDLGGNPSPAAAAVAWGHPFAYRETPGSGFGMRNGSMHEGQDYPAPEGTPIFAVASGSVSARGVLGTNGAYGNALFINHGEGWSSRYAHMSAPSPAYVGQTISRGQLIGFVGNTGRSYGSHLHIELRLNGTAVDPLPYIQNAPLAGGAVPPTPTTISEELLLVLISQSASADGLIKAGQAYADTLTAPLTLLSGDELSGLDYWATKGIPYRKAEWPGENIRNLVKVRGLRPWDPTTGRSDYAAAVKY